MTPSIIPCPRYDDAARAIDWLCAAFGFEKHLVVPGEDGTITHSQLTRPGGMIMVGTRRDPGPPSNDPIYVIVKDPDALRAHAAAHGAEVGELVDHDYGGRGFPAKDCEGHEWYFGSYDPLDASTHAKG